MLSVSFILQLPLYKCTTRHVFFDNLPSQTAVPEAVLSFLLLNDEKDNLLYQTAYGIQIKYMDQLKKLKFVAIHLIIKIVDTAILHYTQFHINVCLFRIVSVKYFIILYRQLEKLVSFICNYLKYV